LDAEDQLKEGDQGASFQAFVRLILSQSKQDELEKMVVQLEEIAELAEQLEGKQRVRGMIGSLSAEAEKVLQVTRRLNSTLRRLLDARASTTRLRIAEVLCEIRALAARNADNPPNVEIEVLTDLELLNVHQRTFWEPPVQFEELKLSNMEQSDDERVLAFRHLAEMQHLDWEAMRANIASSLEYAEQITLPDLLQAHPATGGTIEVLGYIQLAHDDGHTVDENQLEVVLIKDAHDRGDPKPYEVPRIVFLSDRLRLLRSQIAVGVSSNG
jgi:hypothetical protein